MSSSESIESSNEAWLRPSAKSGFFRPNNSVTPQLGWAQGMFFKKTSSICKTLSHVSDEILSATSQNKIVSREPKIVSNS